MDLQPLRIIIEIVVGGVFSLLAFIFRSSVEDLKISITVLKTDHEKLIDETKNDLDKILYEMKNGCKVHSDRIRDIELKVAKMESYADLSKRVLETERSITKMQAQINAAYRLIGENSARESQDDEE